MKKIAFTKEQKLLHHLILHSCDVPMALGLFDGMTGIMLVLAHYARVRKQPLVENAADFLMSRIINNMTESTVMDLANGIAGIGWGIEYLIQNGYMKGCGAELTGELDERIMNLDVRRMTDDSLGKGLCGLFHYVAVHAQGAMLQGKTVFDAQYLNDWLHILQNKQAENPQEKKWGKMYKVLDGILKGGTFYKPDLLPFIIPMRYLPVKRLGLRHGLAGYVEMQLQAEKKEE